ncbi:hypothetical protein KAR91_69030, partial [Candidatus Pacearchaeota archaeon]|nr:hypothetical protein [Candidatus Pacearchaeota archaeon]
MTEKEATAEIKTPKLVKASADYSIMWPTTSRGTAPWSPSEIDKLEFVKHDDWKVVLESCRYYYKRDPFASTVVNKIVDLAINDIVIHKGEARDSIIGIVEGIKGQLLHFLRNAALEYLTTGLVVPEVSFDTVPRKELHRMGIKRFGSLNLPVDMWIRDASTIIIKDPMFGGRKSY